MTQGVFDFDNASVSANSAHTDLLWQGLNEIQWKHFEYVIISMFGQINLYDEAVALRFIDSEFWHRFKLLVPDITKLNTELVNANIGYSDDMELGRFILERFGVAIALKVEWLFINMEYRTYTTFFKAVRDKKISLLTEKLISYERIIESFKNKLA